MSNISKEPEFWGFMEVNGPKTENSKNNYISWLRFVSDNFHSIDESLNKDMVEELCFKIRSSKDGRDIYKQDKDVSNIKSALNKYCKFIESTFNCGKGEEDDRGDSQNPSENAKNITMKNLKYIIYREGDYYVSQCLNIEVASFGTNIDEALSNLKEAVELYMEDDKSLTHFHEVGEFMLGEFALSA
jgi:predicted RNase H-like HicB family nuclease